MSFDRNALAALLTWLGLGLLLGLLERPYQWLSQVGFELQRRLWLDAVGVPWHGAALVFVGASLLLWLAWGPLAAGRGGGLTLSWRCSRVRRKRRCRSVSACARSSSASP